MVTLNKLVVGLTLALSLYSCNEVKKNKTLSICDVAFPEIAEQCELEIKMKKGNKVHCVCTDKNIDDLYGCRYVQTQGYEVYFCSGGED